MAAFNHQFVPISTGLTPHVISLRALTQPAKACVILLHGFPDTNWGWRHLLRPIAEAGFDVYAPSMRGYGPYDKKVIQTDEDCSMENVCKDVEALMVALLVDRAIIVGHDWGGTTAWNFSCHYPHRTLAVASFCTPFFTVPSENPWPKMQANPGRFAYQLVFQTDDARQVLEQDFERTVKIFMRASTDESIGDEDVPFQSKLMGLDLINGTTTKIKPASQSASSRSSMHTEGDLRMYMDQFRRSGFLNPLRWYRNVERNWLFNQKIRGKRVTMPALMVTAENDGILTPSMTKDMPKHCDDLEIVHIKQASHWILQEQPKDSARALCNWLKSLEAKKVLPHRLSSL